MKKNHIGFEIKTVNNLIKRRIEMSDIKHDVDNMTGMHAWIIGYIAEKKDEDVFQRDIEERFEIRRSTATGIINLMEKNGLVIRKKVDYDARLKKLVLTEKALEVNKLIEKDIDNIEALITKGISEEELNIFRKTISQIKTNLNEYLMKKGGNLDD